MTPVQTPPVTPGNRSGPDSSGGPFTTAQEREVLDVPARVIAAWAQQDAAAIAEVFAPDGILVLPGDVLKQGRTEIRAFLGAAFAGPFRGTRLADRPLAIRFIGADIAVLRTEGGILLDPDSDVAPELAVRSTWACVRRGEQWQLAGFQNSPRGPGATLRW
jgi:uncharacterized protein (TIGR02246 family)